MSFAAPAVLFALVALPAIWWLLRLTPPRPKAETFPPARIVAEISDKEETPSKTPWWLTALRLLLAALLIVALAGPTLRASDENAPGEGPLLVILDNGWAAAADWPTLRDAALTIVGIAENDNRPVALVATAEDPGQMIAPSQADQVADRIQALAPQPFAPDYQSLLPQLETIAATAGFGGAAWLSDGLGGPGPEALAILLQEAINGPIAIYYDADARLLGLVPPSNTAAGLIVPVIRDAAAETSEGVVLARDLRGRAIGEAPFRFDPGAARTEVLFSMPTELRNEIIRLEIGGQTTAGAVQLLDDRYRRRTVGILSGEGSDQPLLSADYYISRALTPFADLWPTSTDIAQSVTDMIAGGTSIIILADIGTLPADAETALTAWIENGGTLLRFAGPRLAAAEPSLIPVELRFGGRTLGGALSWEEPQPLGPFPEASPFFGLEVPSDVLVERQVLAEPTAELSDRIWAALADGTPLVTAADIGKGRIVLFHVTADTSWSNLPLSGVFVEMLRRIVTSANAPVVELAGAATAGLAPYRILDGYGRFADPGGTAQPITAGNPDIIVDSTHPPGLYGNDDGFRAVSLFSSDAELVVLDAASIAGASLLPYPETVPIALGYWLFAIALLLLLADTLAVLWLAGAVTPQRKQIAALALVGLLLPALPDDAKAQNQLTPADLFALEAANRTALAYVVTGDPLSDEISRAGLTGLSLVLARRTAFEPGDPVGIDIATDELAFFPILYWRVTAEAPMPDATSMARVDAYMRNGGIVLFDTADQLERTGGDFARVTTAAEERLQQILDGVDIPPLEPVPADHVLTKTFYLLQNFSGRFSEGAFWLEILPDDPDVFGGRPARPTDGVSPIMITSNDLAGAWAIEDNGAFMFPMVTTDPRQREFAFRAGINIVMYALTGNYKTDQVHVPDLLERLGQ